MFSWLNGPGAVFREPRPGSTNYLGAYDNFGRLIRASDVSSKRRSERAQGSTASSDDVGDEDDVAMERNPDEGEGESKKKDGEVPPETIEDLRPFPQNAFFQSQSVLSEELRDEIYKRVTERGMTVRQVSQDLGVDMARVGAVVRLKRVEAKWVAEVRVSFSR